MGLKPLALALLLLLPLGLPSAGAQAEPPFLVEPATGDLATTFRFRAPDRLFGPNLLRDPAFAEGLAAWAAESEVETPATATFDNGTATLAVGEARNGRTVFLVQEVNVTPGKLDFRVDVRLAAGQVHRGVLLLREVGAEGAERDTLVPYVPGPEWSQVRATLDAGPGARTMKVLLRYEMQPGLSGAVAFRDPALRTSPSLSWGLAGEAATGSHAERRFEREGNHTVTLDADGRRVGSQVVRVVNRPPVAAFSSVRTERGWTLDGRASHDPDAPALLENGGFARGAEGWTLDAPEVAGDARLEAARGDGRDLLRVRVGASHPAGSVWAYQELVRTPRGAPLEFQVDVRDHGGHGGYALVLREAGPVPRDTLLQAPPSREWQTLGATWTPRPDATALYVQLRFLVGDGQPATVEFSNASLAPAKQHLWRVDNRTVGRDAVIPWPSLPEGPHEVLLQVTDARGARSERTQVLEAPRLAEGNVTGPALVLAGRPATWSVAEARFPGLELLRDGAFEKDLAGWGFVADEVGGNATATLVPGAQGSAARLAYHAQRAGSVFLVQEVPLRPGTSYELAFQRRDTGVREYGIILRELGFNATLRGTPEPWKDRVVTLPSAENWTASVHRWQPAFNDSTRVQVYLRVLAEEGDRAEAFFDEASFAPRRAANWSLDGEPKGGGLALTLAAIPPGDHVLTATLRSSGQTSTLRLPFHVLDATAVLHPALEGGVRAAWDVAPGAPEGVVRLTRENRSTDHPGARGEAFDPPGAGPNATYALEFVAASGARVTLANGTLRPGAFAELVNLTQERPTRGGEARILVRALDPRVQTLEAVLEGEPIPLSPVGDDLWEGTWRVPLGAWTGADLAFRGADASGARGETRAEAVAVETFRSGAPLAWVGLVAAAAALAWGAPMLQEVVRRRRGG